MAESTDTNTGRKVIAHVAISLDGSTSEAGGGMGWIYEHAVAEQTAAVFEGIWRGASTVLLGRVNFEGYQAVWPPVAKDPDIGWFPDSAERNHDLAVWLDEVEKVVVSRTLTETTWSNSRVAEDLEAEVRALKQAQGRDIIVLSSVSVIQQLLRADLVDELRIAVLPKILGAGLRLFPDDLPASSWRLVGTTTYASGAVGMQYSRER